LAVEHVIPRALLSERLVLTDTCRRWNNFFACSFESVVMGSDYMREFLLAFDPQARKRGSQYLGQVSTERGTVEHRWLEGGIERLGAPPDPRIQTRTLAFGIRGSLGGLPAFIEKFSILTPHNSLTNSLFVSPKK
jgi:hypothetical protein